MAPVAPPPASVVTVLHLALTFRSLLLLMSTTSAKSSFEALSAMAAGSWNSAAVPTPSTDPGVSPLAPPPARVLTLYAMRSLHCTRRTQWLPVSETRYTPGVATAATPQGALNAATCPNVKSTNPAGLPPARVTAEPSSRTRRNALFPMSITSKDPSRSTRTPVGRLNVTLKRGPSPCPGTRSVPAKVTKLPLPSSSAILWLPVSATSTLMLPSWAMPPEQPPPPLSRLSPLPNVATAPLARFTTRSSAALFTLSVKKSCVEFLLMAAPVGSLVAAFTAPTPSTLALMPVPTSVEVTRVAVEVARTRLFPWSAV